MKTGLADIYSNRRAVAIGSGFDLDAVPELNGEPATASRELVLVATRGQAGLVRVTFWNGAAPDVGQVVFRGQLALADGCISVFDLERISIFTRSVGEKHSLINIAVDEPGAASRIDVLVGSGDNHDGLPQVAGLPLFTLRTSNPTMVDPTDKLGIILSASDVPVCRLATAMKLISHRSSDTPPTVVVFWFQMVVEWVRWLTPRQSNSTSQALGLMIEHRLSAFGSTPSDEDLSGLATEIISLA